MARFISTGWRERLPTIITDPPHGIKPTKLPRLSAGYVISFRSAITMAIKWYLLPKIMFVSRP
jgi:hypothetical protein